MPNKKPSDATPKPDGGNPTLTTRLIDRIMQKMDLDQLAADLADRLGERLLATVSTDTLVNAIFEKYNEEFQQTFTQAILDRL